MLPFKETGQGKRGQPARARLTAPGGNKARLYGESPTGLEGAGCPIQM